MKSISSSKPANSLLRNDPLFRNDQATRRTERAILRPIGVKAFGISDEERVFIFKYYRDMMAGPPSSGERLMLISFEDLQELSGKPPSDIVDVRALCALVVLDEFMEDEGDGLERALTRAIARQR
jgi:hypothetical protein